MNKKIKRIASILSVLIIVVFLGLTTVTHADFGDISDYSDSDWGGDWDSDWGSDYSYYGDSSGSGDISSVDFGVGLIAIIVILVFVLFFKKGGSAVPPAGTNANTEPKPAQTSYMPDMTQNIIKEIQENDPDFSYVDFKTYVRRCFIDMQEAWSRRDISTLQTILTPNLYEQTKDQVDIKLRDHIVNKIERVAVDNMYLTQRSTDSQLESVVVVLSAQMVDYQIRENTGELIAGSKDKLWHYKYKITVVRTTGMKTPTEKEESRVLRCPNCAATLPTAAFGRCEYCGSLVTSGKYGWVISEITSTRT